MYSGAAAVLLLSGGTPSVLQCRSILPPHTTVTVQYCTSLEVLVLYSSYFEVRSYYKQYCSGTVGAGRRYHTSHQAAAYCYCYSVLYDYHIIVPVYSADVLRSKY